jgi:RNA polymerase sigma-70 factor (ECF subfamily)
MTMARATIAQSAPAGSDTTQVPPEWPLRVSGGAVPSRPELDGESLWWWQQLHGTAPQRRDAIALLHERLRREAAFHIRLRVRALSAFPRSDIDDLAVEAADDALMALLRKLDNYRGDSQFWTWARRFAALEAPVSIRRRIGRDHVGIARDPDVLLNVADRGPSVTDQVELRERLQTVTAAIIGSLTARQRKVMVAVTINGVAPKALAAELSTTPGAIYKTLHDARRTLRARGAAS